MGDLRVEDLWERVTDHSSALQGRRQSGSRAAWRRVQTLVRLIKNRAGISFSFI